MDILLVDDHTIVRQGLRALLEVEDGLNVVGEEGDGRAALDAVQRLRPDVVVMDVAMPGLNGLEATQRITSMPGAPRVIVLSMYTDLEHVVHALLAGASGYVRKEDADAELVAAVRTGRPGDWFLSPQIDVQLVRQHLRRAAKQNGQASYEPLSAREREVLQLVAEGRLNKQIALLLGIAERTVEAHRASIMRKLGLTDPAGLIRYAVGKGIVPPGA